MDASFKHIETVSAPKDKKWERSSSAVCAAITDKMLKLTSWLCTSRGRVMRMGSSETSAEE